MIFKKRIAGKFAGKFAAKRTSGKVKGTLIVRVRCLDSDDERKEKKNAKGLYIIPFRRIEMMEDATVKQLECRLMQLDLGYAPPPKKYQLFSNGLVLGVVRGDTFAAIADDNTRSKTLEELGLHQRILCACDCHALRQSDTKVHLFRARRLEKRTQIESEHREPNMGDDVREKREATSRSRSRSSNSRSPCLSRAGRRATRRSANDVGDRGRARRGSEEGGRTKEADASPPPAPPRLKRSLVNAAELSALEKKSEGGYADEVYEELLKALSIVEDPSSWPRAHDAWVKKLCSVVELEPLKQLCETFDIVRQSSSSKPKIINLILQNINFLQIINVGNDS